MDFSLKKLSFDQRFSKSQSGNVLIIILIAIALIAALTAAIQGSSDNSVTIDEETLLLRSAQVRQYVSELENGVFFVMQNGVSENEIRFAHPSAPSSYGDLDSESDKSNQLFSSDGGNVHYKMPPNGISDGSAWEFYGQTALPSVGSDEADLIAVIPNVTKDFCEVVNETLGYTGQPTDSSTCLKSPDSKRFSDSTQFADSPNTTDESSFSFVPAKEGCVKCTNDNSYHFFHVLMAR